MSTTYDINYDYYSPEHFPFTVMFDWDMTQHVDRQQWCANNISEPRKDWFSSISTTHSTMTFHFRDREDAALFALTWS